MTIHVKDVVTDTNKVPPVTVKDVMDLMIVKNVKNNFTFLPYITLILKEVTVTI